MTVASGQFYFGDLPGKRVSFQSALTRAANPGRKVTVGVVANDQRY